MKQYVAVLSLLLSTAALAKQPTFEVIGNVAGKDGLAVEIAKDFYGDQKVLGTDTIRNQQFHITCPVDEIIPLTLAIKQGKSWTTYTVILEEGKIQFSLSAQNNLSITGGVYNKLLFGFQRTPAYINNEKDFQAITKGGHIDSVRGTDKEYIAVQLFLRKDELRTDYLNNIMNTSKDPHARVIAAIMASLQPDRKKAMAVVEQSAGALGENSFVIRSARKMNKEQEEMISRREGIMVGKPFPDFTAFTTKGDSMKLSSIVQQHPYTLLQFWASWCVPCRHEVPLLKDLYKTYQSKGLAIVSFSMDDNKTSWIKASEAISFPWTDLSDLKAFNSAIIRDYQVSSIPANVIIDQKGNIVASNLVGEDLDKKVKEIFK